MTFEIYREKPTSEQKITFRLIEENDEIILWACDGKGKPYNYGRVTGIKKDSGKLHIWGGVSVHGLPTNDSGLVEQI